MEGILTISIEGDWSGGPDTALVNVNGFTTSASYYLKILTDAANRASASGRDATRYILSVTNDICIAINDDYVWIDGLQIEVADINVNYECPIYLGAATATNNLIQISNCRLMGNNDATYRNRAINSGDADTNLLMWNTIITGCNGAAASDGVYLFVATATLYNCVIYGCQDDGIDVDGGTVNVYNCAVFANGDDFEGAFNTISHCASDDGDTTDASDIAESGGGAAWPSDFTAAATGDFTLVVGSNLIGAGVVDPGSGLFSDDIEGTARGAAWDLGAFEYVAAGGTTYEVTSTDGIKFGDLGRGAATFFTSATDGLRLGDGDTPLATFFTGAQDGVIFGDLVSSDATYYTVTADGLKLGDLISAEAGKFVDVTDGLKLGDIAGAAGTYFVTSADGINLGDAAASLYEYFAKVADGIKFGDLTDADVGGAWTGIVLDGIKFGDSAQMSAEWMARSADEIKFGDNASVIMTWQVGAIDGAKFGDIAKGIATMFTSLADEVKFGDTASGTVSVITTTRFINKNTSLHFIIRPAIPRKGLAFH